MLQMHSVDTQDSLLVLFREIAWTLELELLELFLYPDDQERWRGWLKNLPPYSPTSISTSNNNYTVCVLLQCYGDPPEHPNSSTRLKLELDKVPEGLSVVIDQYNNDIQKLLEGIQLQSEVSSKAGRPSTTNHHILMFIVRSRKRKRRIGLGPRKSRKRPLLIKAPQGRQRFDVRTKMAMATRKENSTFCFHADWAKLATALDPREEYLAELPVSANQDSVHNISSSNCNDIVFYNYDDLKVATDNFDSQPVKDGGRLIGSGSYGNVFLAQIVHCGIKKDAAVKKFKQPRNERPSVMRTWRKQLQTEVSVLLRSKTENIVRLFGISTDGPELCIVYEYMRDGTLAQNISKGCCSPLGWRDRMEVLLGACQAMKYLHTIMEPPTIHRDIKSSNILVLIDGTCTAKVADFGLACSTEYEDDPDASFEETGSMSVGTKCYMPPESFQGRFSTKTDIYALGVVIYEIVTGLPPYSRVKKKDLVSFMTDLEGEGVEMSILVDPRARWPSCMAMQLLCLAKQCTDKSSYVRPRITEVLERLETLM